MSSDKSAQEKMAMPITRQPNNHQKTFGFKSPRDDCRPEDCCCCCLFVYLLFGKEIESPSKYAFNSVMDKKKQEDKSRASFCYFNNITGEDTSYERPNNDWYEKYCLQDNRDDDSDGWMGAMQTSNSSNGHNASPFTQGSASTCDDNECGGDAMGASGGDAGGGGDGGGGDGGGGE